MKYSDAKRIVDITAATCALAVFSPVIAVTAAVSFAVHKKNPFIGLPRLGKDGKIFKIYKIRSMYGAANEISDNNTEERLSGFGRIIRRLSLDEMPQFVNVIKGDMSLIGPRPYGISCITPEMYNNNDAVKKRLSVRPGMVSGIYLKKNIENTDYSKDFSDDIDYIEKMSAKTDIKIIFGISKIIHTHAKCEENRVRITNSRAYRKELTI